MAGRRLALLIDASGGNHFPAHPTSPNAVEILKEVLSAADIGRFEVTSITNADEQTTTAAISRFFGGKQADDLLLFYFVGNLVFSGDDQFWFRPPTTEPSAIGTTSISSEFLLAEINASAARNVVLVLDLQIGAQQSFRTVALDQRLQAPGKSLAVLAGAADPQLFFQKPPTSNQIGYSLTEVIGEILLELRNNRNQMTVTDLAFHLRDRLASSLSAMVTRIDDAAGQIVLASHSDESLQPVAKIDIPAPEPSFAPDENIQFTVYRPSALMASRWQRMLVFTHVEETPDQTQDQKTPAQLVVERAQRILAEEFDNYRPLAADSHFPVPRESEIALVPEVPKITFNPARRSFVWATDLRIHDESFLMKASDELAGSLARGRLSIFLGHLLLADIAITFRVEPAGSKTAVLEQPWSQSSARPFRKVFASYSHLDMQIVEAMEHHVKALGYDYLRDVLHLRSGQVWNDRLLAMINDADIFQLFWSSNAARSSHVEREWRHALALNREAFLRPAFWEVPMPTPPEPLRDLHFYRLPVLVPALRDSVSAQAGYSHGEEAKPDETYTGPMPALPVTRAPLPSRTSQSETARPTASSVQRKRFGFLSAVLSGIAAACLLVFASFFGGMFWFSRETAQMQVRATPAAAAPPLVQATAAATETPPAALVVTTPVPAVSPALEATSTPALASATPRRTGGPSSDPKKTSSDHVWTKPKPPFP